VNTWLTRQLPQYDCFEQTTTAWVVPQQICLYTQKIHNLLSDDVRRKYEVLSRLKSNDLRIDQYLNTLSPQNLIQYDLFVLRKVFLFLRENPQLDIELHINISPETLSSHSFMLHFMRIAQEVWFIDFYKIRIEILENGSFSDRQLYIVNSNIMILHSMRVKIWVDDYPNANNNNELLWLIQWIDFVKIDKWPIIKYLDHNITSEELINRMCFLLKEIDQYSQNQWIDVIIEWVENQQVALLLRENFGKRVHFFQWYYFERPQSIFNLLTENHLCQD